MNKIIGIFLIIFTLQSCYYDKEEILYPVINNECDTISVNYSITVADIISQNCLSCHSNASASTSGGGIPLEDYSDVKANADNGKLLGSIKHEAGYSQMPKDGSKLNDCNISKIEIWINSEAANN